ncbi:hypothetical protein CQA53_09880 [Helicobacter didelphidarum]|uniref:Uncharacterized protein n=1 Tax=Helicobacter didelphidarum TaxID=2040648 RepID=A0A3D8I8Y5_9HELI|nr:hypothetical protein [Helicobacter didelphidarum]RDU61623.1 hypothetical protein CQA53_09880 [Helicobacter didelphidarum]
MRLVVSIFFIVSIMYASVYQAHFQDMLSSQISYNSTLYKDKETEGKIYYGGKVTLSGILEWQMYQDEVDFYWRLVFFPDIPNDLPRLFANDNTAINTAIFLNDTLKKDVSFQKNSFLQIYNILPNQLNPIDEYILGGIAIRAILTLENYYITHKSLDSEADTPYYATIANDVKVLSSIRKWYIAKQFLPSEYILSYASKDSYINLRESPNGKILRAIQKDEMGDLCKSIESAENKGLILELGRDTKNPKWLKVAYIPPESKDTSKTIYGVIHESQVSYDCAR